MSDFVVLNKVVVPEEHWDYAWPLGSTAVMITTVDTQGRVNAAGFATCVRVAHGPIYISFTTSVRNDTYRNVLDTGEFCVNLVPFVQRVMEATRVVGLAFPTGVNELEKAGLTAIPSITIKAPRIADCHAHFECKVEWTKEWSNRCMVTGALQAVTVNEGCMDENWRIVWDEFKPASFCGAPYQEYFVPSYNLNFVDRPYHEEIPPRPNAPVIAHWRTGGTSL
ncbi:MAG TPA: flavin reductase family protein [Dehalococcoidia bacterium]|nr:flavin reductase family protein [Dehalococcoidia bacterium]